jgi:hypothetical protein
VFLSKTVHKTCDLVNPGCGGVVPKHHPFVDAVFENIFKHLQKPYQDMKSVSDMAKLYGTNVYSNGKQHPYNTTEKMIRLWSDPAFSHEIIRKFNHKRNQQAAVYRSLFRKFFLLYFLPLPVIPCLANPFLSIWLEKYIEHHNLSEEDMLPILKAALHPRANRQQYTSSMKEILMLMCFTEGSSCPARKPFVDKDGREVARSDREMLPILSASAMRALHQKTISCFIFPAEETFICLVLAKFLLFHLRRTDMEMVTQFLDQSQVILEPWRGAKADSVDLKDLSFFFSRRSLVDKCFLEDKKLTDVREHWFYIDFAEQIASAEGRSVDEVVRTDSDTPLLGTDEPFVPLPDFPDYMVAL